MKSPTRKTQDAIISYLRAATEHGTQNQAMRHSFEKLDREYARESDMSAKNRDAKGKNDAGDKNTLRDITVPVLYPQTETAHSYLVGVFLTGYPIFATVSSPENMVAADMMDAVNAQHQVKGGWVRGLSLAMRDGLKYNVMAVEVDWKTKKTYALKLDDKNEVQTRPSNYEGNCIRRLDMYNTFWDNRVPIAEVHENGEFAGFHEIMSRIKLKQLLVDIEDEWKLKNDKEAMESAPDRENFFQPSIVPDKFEVDHERNQGFNWVRWATNMPADDKARINYQDYYEVTTLYARILPDDFGLDVPARNTPQIWKFIIVNNQVVVYARRLTNAHNYLPIIFGSPLEDGLEYQTKSFAENLVDIQDMSTSLWKIKIASARRNVSDRMIYDARFIRPEDINSNNPSAKIPVRTSQYLDDIRKAVYQIPYNEGAAASAVGDAMQIQEMGRSISGISRPVEGQFMKGNRTLGEYQDIRGNGDARLQTMAYLLEAQFFTPIKEIIKYNVLQYVKPSSVYFSVKKTRVEINPQILRDISLDFKMSDGLVSSAKIADSDFLSSLMQLIPQNAELQQRFDIVKLVGYLASLRNVPGLDAFERDAPIPTGAPE